MYYAFNEVEVSGQKSQFVPLEDAIAVQVDSMSGTYVVQCTNKSLLNCSVYDNYSFLWMSFVKKQVLLCVRTRRRTSFIKFVKLLS